jgi:hypothetical protein
MVADRLSASFRDPSGFVFSVDGELYRQINSCYARDFDLLMSSGLYADLTGKGWLIDHEEEDSPKRAHGAADAHYKTIKPALIPYISYPYEWSFSQLKDAALITLQIHRTALQYGMALKDASSFNIQFVGSRPVFIDTLSFEHYVEGSPWVAYKQFCQHFLGPLALMASSDVRLRHLLRGFIDGLPVDLVSKLLPRVSFFKYGLLSHIHAHAASQKRHQDSLDTRTKGQDQARLSKRLHLALIDSLISTTEKCRLGKFETEWGEYYSDTNYSESSMVAKEQLVAEFVDTHAAEHKVIHDLGANTGQFSRIIANADRYVISHDIDDLAVERNYLENKAAGNESILPLLLDLTNPSPAQGWAHVERDSFVERIGEGAVIALALMHHLAIGNNLPFGQIASFFAKIGSKLIIEFVPKDDSQVQRLLSSRKDIFADYCQAHFERAFSEYFEILEKRPIEGSKRILYAMARRCL